MSGAGEGRPDLHLAASNPSSKDDRFQSEPQCEFVGEGETEFGLPGYMLFRCILPAGHQGLHRRRVHGGV